MARKLRVAGFAIVLLAAAGLVVWGLHGGMASSTRGPAQPVVAAADPQGPSSCETALGLAPGVIEVSSRADAPGRGRDNTAAGCGAQAPDDCCPDPSADCCPDPSADCCPDAADDCCPGDSADCCPGDSADCCPDASADCCPDPSADCCPDAPADCCPIGPGDCCSPDAADEMGAARRDV